MKKILSLVTTLCLFATANTALANSTVRFTGDVTNDTCTITTPDQTVYLGSVASSELANGQTSPKKPFSLILEGCPISGGVTNGKRDTKVTVFFAPNTAKHDDTTLKNNAQGINAATNVGVQILQGDTPLNLFTTNGQQGVTAQELSTLEAGSAVFNLNAHMIGLANDVAPGQVEVVVPFEVRYE